MISVERWLKLIAIIHIVGGVLLPLVVFTPIATPYFEHFRKAFPQGDLASMKFLVGVFGPTVASWGLLFYYATGKAFQSKTSRDWWFLVSSILLWAMIDSAFSTIFGVWFHLYLNGAIMLLILSLLVIEKHLFRSSANGVTKKQL